MKHTIALALASLYTVISIIFLPATQKHQKEGDPNTLNECLTSVDLYFDSLFESVSLLEPLDGPERIFDFSSQVARNIYSSTMNIVNINKCSMELYGSSNEYGNYDTQYVIDDWYIHEDYAFLTLDISFSGHSPDQVLPVFAVEGKNYFTLSNRSGTWKIMNIDAENKDSIYVDSFLSHSITLLDRTSINDLLSKHLSLSAETDNEYLLYDTLPNADINKVKPYNPARAIKYANKYCTANNEYFIVTDQNNDCQNFVSQSISYGFGTTDSYSVSSSYMMTSIGSGYYVGWYGTRDGLTHKWANCMAFYEYGTQNIGKYGLEGFSLSGTSVRAGDVLQYATNGIYNHSVICVDSSSGIFTTYKFAQHSPNRYYYGDTFISKVIRGFRPTGFRFVVDGQNPVT